MCKEVCQPISPLVFDVGPATNFSLHLLHLYPRAMLVYTRVDNGRASRLQISLLRSIPSHYAVVVASPLKYDSQGSHTGQLDF